ncbi:unnamed protein product [Ambrosiozyma monospora]|uniref:Unnamed protein product n=1 Tax=Ambrosiozyma monospora TaxID=43982 RepID=A0A9W6YTX3_AMBMO|nr:unnamed protein product [Ambrosiozyma monospora]
MYISKRVRIFSLTVFLLLFAASLHSFYTYHDPNSTNHVVRLYDKFNVLTSGLTQTDADPINSRADAFNNNNIQRNKDSKTKKKTGNEMMNIIGAVLDDNGDVIIGNYVGDSEVVPDFSDPNAPTVKDKATLAKEAKLLEELKEKEELNEKLRQKQENKQRLKDKKVEEQHSLFTTSKLLTDQIDNLQLQHQQLGQTVMKNSVDHSDPAKVIHVQDHDGFDPNLMDESPQVDITKGDPIFQNFFTKFLQLLFMQWTHQTHT